MTTAQAIAQEIRNHYGVELTPAHAESKLYGYIWERYVRDPQWMPMLTVALAEILEKPECMEEYMQIEVMEL